MKQQELKYAKEMPESELVLPPRGLSVLSLTGDRQAVIRTPTNQRITPAPHVQAFANALLQEVGANSFGTYYGHSPTPELGLDIFTPVNSRTLGDAVCTFALENWDRFALDYIIYRQHIWNPEVSRSWRKMEDRGDPTQNHMDHAHTSHLAKASGSFEPVPTPTLKEVPELFTYSTARDVDGGSIWLVIEGIPHRIHRIEDAQQINKADIPNFGEMSVAFHNLFPEKRG